MSRRLHRIELTDFEAFAGEIPPEVDAPSQLSFPLLYLTRNEMQLRTCIDRGVKFLVGWSSENPHALYGPPLPLCSSPGILKDQLRRCHRSLVDGGVLGQPREGLYLVLLNDEWAARVGEIGGQVHPTPDDDNYVYDSADLGQLRGASLRRHREMVRSFERRNPHFGSEPLTSERIGDARSVIERWLRNKIDHLRSHPADSPDYYHLLRDDFGSALLSLEHLDTLSIRGRIYYRDGEPVGFISGTPLAGDTFLYLHHKNLPIRGLAEVIYSDFSRSLGDEFRYVNAGQDLGIPSLRSFKRRLSPVRLLRTWRAFVPHKVLLGGVRERWRRVGEGSTLPSPPLEQPGKRPGP